MNAKAFLSAAIALSAASGAFCEEPQASQAGASVPQKEIVSRPRAEPYLDEASGVEFPAELGGMVKTQVVKNANPYYGTVVRYASLDGSCADVYIYSLGQEPDSETLKAHFQGVLKVIAKLPGGSGPVRSLSFKSEGDAKLGSKGSIAAKKAVFSFEAAGGDLFDSELLIFGFKDKVVKLRVSRPRQSSASAETFERAAGKLFEASASAPLKKAVR